MITALTVFVYIICYLLAGILVVAGYNALIIHRERSGRRMWTFDDTDYETIDSPGLRVLLVIFWPIFAGAIGIHRAWTGFCWFVDRLVETATIAFSKK